MCVNESFTNAKNGVNPQSRSLHRSKYHDHPKSFVNHFYKEYKEEEWLKPVRGDQSLEKIVELGKDPGAASSNCIESQNPREETREETCDHPVVSTIPLRQEIDERSKEDQGIKMQRIKSGPEANKDEKSDELI